jgi:hypothetical protein
MNSGHPPSTVQQPESAQILATDLENVRSAPRPWGAVPSLITGFISLGVLPTLLWHDRFKDFVEDERHHLRRFAEWMRLHSGHPATMHLRTAGERLGPRTLLSALSVISVVGLVFLFASEISSTRPIVDQVLSYTYEFNQIPPGKARSQHEGLFAAWSIALSVAYLFHWIQVQAHASDTRRFVRYANDIFQANGVLRIPQPRVGLGIACLWATAAAMLASKGAWWGVAMAMSGAVQYRYMAGQSPRLRRMLAARVREMARLPANGTGEKCPHAGCLAPLPAGAKFCTRCGRNLSA